MLHEFYPTCYPTFVPKNKTSVYLSDDEVARLTSLAIREGTSQSETIRRAIRSYEPKAKADREFALIGVAEGPGDSIAEIEEGALLEGFGS
jgi:predicted transcriptional regulator